jgi:preprotein translocase subunit YajC
VYAAKSLEHLRATGYWQYGIHGEVNLWGTVVEHELGWRAQFAYPKALFLPHDTLPLTFAATQSRLKTLIAYHADIFVADPKGDIPLWTNDSGYDSAGLDYLIKRSKQYYDRRRQQRTLKKGDRVALLGVGIALVEQVDDQDVHVVLRNRYALKISRNHVAWDQQNMRWEASLAGVFQTNAGRISNNHDETADVKFNDAQ